MAWGRFPVITWLKGTGLCIWDSHNGQLSERGGGGKEG